MRIDNSPADGDQEARDMAAGLLRAARRWMANDPAHIKTRRLAAYRRGMAIAWAIEAETRLARFPSWPKRHALAKQVMWAEGVLSWREARV